VGIESADCINVRADVMDSSHLDVCGCKSWEGVQCNCCCMERVVCVYVDIIMGDVECFVCVNVDRIMVDIEAFVC
jgi:hypothetical protein